jgi:large subunit ribosomal protein L13
MSPSPLCGPLRVQLLEHFRISAVEWRIVAAHEPAELAMKTVSISSENAQREWLIVDLEGVTVGKAAARIATILRGKHKPSYTPHADTGDFVVVINADKVVFTGNKLKSKLYRRHSGYPGGLREFTAEQVLDRHPTRIIETAVKGMLPKNPLGRQMARKLKVYAGAEHPHVAQSPRSITI